MIQLILGGMTKQLVCWKHNFTVQPAKSAQKQLRGKECGLYAIANATSIAFGKYPVKMTYQESVMRAHLCHCFSEKTLEVFPTLK